MPASMWRRTLKAAFDQPDTAAHLLFLRDSQTVTRIHFLHAAAHLGVLAELETPSSRDALAERLGVTRTEQFGLMLDLGVSLGELAVGGGRYRLKGRRARALVGANGSVLRALLDEQMGYHASVYEHLPERLRGGELGDYLEATAAVVAESSRVAEPVVASYLSDIVREAGNPRVLDVGCGSGIYLRAASRHPAATGAGIDMQPASVELTRKNLERWGIGDRFDVALGDIRDGGKGIEGTFDVVFLLNNIYYFSPDEWPDLFGTLRSLLKPGGTLALVSMFRGTSPTALNLDLVLACTKGCYALTTPEKLSAALRRAGFTDVRVDQLVARESLLGIRAS
ncbi:class I SAM-dependent methyltransferase [Streptomyces capparidis]